jgi:D-amino-acid dehydrogenase
MSLASQPLEPLTAQAVADTAASTSIVVVGAGIVGLATALTLQVRGHSVLVLERDEIAAGPSRGNAGALAFSDVLPLASPGIMRQAPRWLLDPLGPLALAPRYTWRMAPWLFRFWRASRPAAFARSLQTQVALMQLSVPATRRLLAAAHAEDMLRSDGNFHLYEGEAPWRASLAEWALKARHGIAFEHLTSAAAIAALQPGLSPALTHATFVPNWQSICDPLRLCHRLASAFVQTGGRIRRARVLRLENRGERVNLHCEGLPPVPASRVVLAGGAWSHQLAATLGERIPLETERGYNTTLPAGAFDLKRQLTFPNHGFVMTDIAGSVRVGGAVELAGLEAPPRYERAQTMLSKAKRFAPGLVTEGGIQWMGMRPSLPDSLPAIGPLATSRRVLCAFGHGHLGLTQAAATAEIIASLVGGNAPPIDIQALSPTRFA